MPIEFGSNSLLTRFVWESANLASGGGTTNLAWNVASTGITEVEETLVDIGNAWIARLRPITDADVTLVEIQWETATQSGAAPVNSAGTVTAAQPPPNAATLASYHALGKGARYRGRSFWYGWVNESNVDERGIIGVTQVGQLQTALDNFFLDVFDNPNVLGQGIAQSTTEGQKTSPVIPWPTVGSRVIQPVMATQRRRLRR